MARPGVTYQDIANAANELKGQAKSITIENVRTILGTGSIGTINQHLRKWKAAQTAIHGIAVQENLPESLIALIKGLWQEIVTQSAAQFQLTEEKLQQEITELKTALEKYKNNNQRWQKLFNQWQQEKIALANEKLTLEQALEFSHKENTTLTTKQDGLHQQLQEKQDRIDELHRLHQQTQHNLEHYRESAREQRLLDQQKFAQEKEQLQTEIKILNIKLNAEQQKVVSLANQCNKFETENKIHEKQYAEIKLEINNLTERLGQSEKENVKLIQEMQNLKKISEENKLILANKSNQLVESQMEIKIFEKQIDELKHALLTAHNQNKLLAQEKWEIAQEKASLEGQIKQTHKMIAI